MSENRIQKEPSTEEILGSIRRIITEDNAQAGHTDAANTPVEKTAEAEFPVLADDVEAEEAVAEEAAPTETVPAENTIEENMSGHEATEDDDILELTDEIVDEAPAAEAQPIIDDQPEEIRREPRFGLSAAPSYETDAVEEEGFRREPVIGTHAEETPPAEQPTQDSAEISDTAAEPLAGYNYSAQVLSSNQESVDQDESAGQEDYPMASTTDGEPEVPESPAMDEPSQPTTGLGAAQEEIVSQAATSAATAALGDLNRAMSEKTERLKVGSDTTVADIVKEMLRPMLREWLDENLPTIVDRAVRREIQKLVDRAQDDV